MARSWPYLVALLLAAALFRTLPLLDNRFHPDEALYGSFARRIISGQDPLLSGVLVDKPPLGFYLTALSLGLFDDGEFGARLPSLYASLVGVALLYALARRLYPARTAFLAAALLAASPFAILFSITLFLDPLLTTAVLWGLWAAARGRPRSLAAAFGVAFAIKQTALLFVPLALALALVRLPPAASPAAAARQLWRLAWPLALALVVAAALSLAWDAARQAPIGFWAQGYADNVPGRFVRANEVVPRARAWVGLLHYASASPVLNLLILVGLPGLLLAGARTRHPAALADGLLAAFTLAYLSAYWLLAFNVWDRYLLPLLPALCLLAARALAWLAAVVARRLPLRPPGARLASLGALAFVAAALAPGVLGAARSAFPIGGDHGAYDGVDHAAQYLRGLPAGSVLYDHWLSWQWGFYLFDAPIYVAWMPSPAALAADLTAFGLASPRFVAVPSWEQDAELRAAAARAGYSFVPRHFSYRRDGSLSVTVYELRPAGSLVHPAGEADS